MEISMDFSLFLDPHAYVFWVAAEKTKTPCSHESSSTTQTLIAKKNSVVLKVSEFEKEKIFVNTGSGTLDVSGFG